MITNTAIVRYSEIGLKGKNRIKFEKKLINNIRSCFDKNKINFTTIKNPRGRIVISGIESCNELNCVFGVSSFSDAVNAGFNMDEIKKTALTLVKDKINGKSFCISCQRLDKNFPFDSLEFSRELGSFIQEKFNSKVDLKNPGLVVYAEIIDGFVYLFTGKNKGPGGLPLGIEGNVIVIIEDEPSLLAALLMMKRGCNVFCVAGKNFDIALLKNFVYGSKVELKILKSDKEINDFAKQNKAKAIIVSDIFKSVKEYGFDVPVYRPLSAMDEKEIAERLDEFRKRVC